MKPPRLARLLLWLTLRGEGSEFVRGDIEEEYAAIRGDEGRIVADRWYRAQAVGSAFAWIERTIARTGEGIMEGLWRDVRFGTRALWRSRGYSAAAVATLGLGLGGVVAVLALAQTVLSPLPFPDSDRLISVAETRNGRPNAVAPANYLDWRRTATTFHGLTAHDFRFASVTVDGVATRGSVALVSGNYFDVLGVEPELGRVFDPTLDTSFPRREAVLAHAAWRDLFAADPAVVGRTFQVEEVTYEVVGVAPRLAALPGQAVQAWLRSPPEAPEIAGFQGSLPDMRDSWYFEVVGRLADDATVASARAEMEAIAARLSEAYPDTNGNTGVVLLPLHELVIADFRPVLRALGLAVGLLLLAALVNVSHLMLARGDARSSELAVRGALGAGRGALLRQVAVEGALVGLAGGLVALGLARWVVSIGVSRLGAALPRADEITVAPSVALVALLLALGTTVLVAVGAHLRGAGGETRARMLRSRGTTAADVTQRALVAAQIAAGIALLSGSVLLGRSLNALASVDLGFADQEVVTLRVALPDARSRAYEERLLAYDGLAESLGALPGVEAVGYGPTSPLNQGMRASLFTFGSARSGDEGLSDPGWQPVSPGFFEALGIPLLRGRAFDARDEPGTPDVGVVNETLAAAFGGDPIGQRVSIGLDGHDRAITIVGVVGDTRTRGPAQPPGPVLYRPATQTTGYGATAAFFSVRSRDADGALLARARETVRAEQPGLPVYSEALGAELGRPFQTAQSSLLWIVGVFSGAALALAMVGVYGVAAYAVRRRRREIGVRMALGARRVDVLTQVVRRGLLHAVFGVPVGVALAVVLGRSLGTVLFSVEPADPVALAMVSLTVMVVAAAALLLPARAAAATDPAAITREE